MQLAFLIGIAWWSQPGGAEVHATLAYHERLVSDAISRSSNSDIDRTILISSDIDRTILISDEMNR